MENSPKPKSSCSSSKDLSSCTFFRADDLVANGPTVLHIALKEANRSDVTPNQLCTHFASLMALMAPELNRVFNSALLDLGIRCNEVKLPSQASQNNITLPTSSECNKSKWGLVEIFACCVFMLLKDITPSTSSQVIEHPGPLGARQAEIVRSKLGQSLAVRKAVIDFIVKSIGNIDLMGKACWFLYNDLSWSGMEVFNCVKDTLFLTNSPLMTDPSLTREVSNFNVAVEAVVGCKHPRFFSFISEESQLAKIDGNKFPTVAMFARIMNDEDLMKIWYESIQRVRRAFVANLGR
ncbi:hypothetical protein ACFE04_014478 [Oxalis oulophora]